MPERARRRQGGPPSLTWLRIAIGLMLVGLAIGLASWAFQQTPREPRPGGNGERKAAGAGARPTTTPRRRPEGLRLTGHVQEQDGTPIKGATVFVLPKKSRGGTRDDLPHEVTDANGRWELRVERVVGCWVGVVARGYMHAYLDGDRVDPGVQMFHVLEDAEPLWITLLDETGTPIGGKGVLLEPWPPMATYFLPGPGARQGETWAVSDEDGELRFLVGSRGPVLLRPHVEGRHADAHPTWLAQPVGDVTVNFRRNRSLHIRLRADDAGPPLQGLATADLYEPANGHLAFSITEVVGPDGLLRIRQGIRPGVYDLHVHVEDRDHVILPALELQGDDPEQPHRVTVTVGPALEEGTVRLRLKGGVTGARRLPAAARRRAPLVYLWRDEPAWRTLRWQPGAPASWNAARRTLVFHLAPGTYHMLVADVLSGCAVIQRDVVVEQGGDVEVSAALAPGLQATTPALRLGDGLARSVQVAATHGLPLPVYGSARGGRVRVSSVRDLLARTAEGDEVLLGPYPVDAVTVDATNWDGTKRQATVRR